MKWPYQNKNRRPSDEKLKLAKQQTTNSPVCGIPWPPLQFTALSLFKVFKIIQLRKLEKKRFASI